MTTVISTAADRQRQRQAEAGRVRKPGRPRELQALLGILLVAALGFLLTYHAVGAEFIEVESALKAGQVLHLNALSQADDLQPLLSFSNDPAERAFIANRIWSHLTRIDGGRARNVGELGTLRVTKAELEPGGRRIAAPTLRARMEDRDSVALLSSAQVAALKPTLIVRTPAEFRRLLWQGLALWALPLLLVHAYWRWRSFPGDQLILPILGLLTALGFLLMISVRDPLRDLPLFLPFAQGVALGAALMIAATWAPIDKRHLRQLKFPALAAAFGLSLLLLVFGSGPGGSDAKVNLFGFQPVELIKVLVVVFLAGYFGERWEFLRELKEKRLALDKLPLAGRFHVPRLEYALPPLIALVIVLFFFFLQRDLGPALVLIFLFLTLWAVARGRSVMVIAGSLAVMLAFWAGYAAGYPRTVTARIGMWLSPWDNFSRGGDHLAQSLWAFASGGATGTGFGLGQPGYVPEAHTDMVLAAIGEELGFFGLLTVLGLFGLLCWRMLHCAWRATDAESFFLGFGLTLLTAFPIVLICGGVTGLLPLSGVATPFLSYGRSSMLAQFLILGLVLAVGARGTAGTSTVSGKPFAERFRRAAAIAGLVVLGVLGACLLRAAWVMLWRADQTLVQGALTVQGDGSRRFRYNPRLQEIADQLRRGTVYDRRGVPLATSDAEEVARHQDMWRQLGVLVDAVPKARKSRFYPLGGYAFHLLGDARNQVNWAADNTSFVERDSRVRLQGYDDFARTVQVAQGGGQEPAKAIERDLRELLPLLRHRYQPDHPDVLRITERARNVRLSIDARVQVAAARILEETVRKAEQSKHGAALIMDAETGELLAAVSYPWPGVLPIEATARNADQLLDRGRYGIYPPGSTFKLVTAMAALQLSPELADQTFSCQALPGGRVGHAVRGFGRPIRDDPTAETPHGAVDLVKGITVSCNAYFAQLATYEVGPKRLLETAFEFGIATAKPNTVERLRLDIPQASYGQGQVIATPLQMARVAATIANGGHAPQGKWVLDESNERNEAPLPILSDGQARLLRQAMRQVVTQGSARQLANVDPPIAGKTGTAEVQGKASHSWFVGFAPYGDSPRKFAFAVLVENGGYGGRVAARAAGQMVATLEELGYFDEQPEGVSGSAPLPADASDSRRRTVP